jgi:glycosyltransferase involved in cell wall biosynthesis
VTRIPLFSRLRIFRFLAAVFAMCRLILKYRIDIVQINGFFESILLIPARLLGCQTIYTRHGPFETDLYKWYQRPDKLAPRLLARWGGHLASRLVCVSETVGTICKRVYPAERIVVIPNWVSRLPTFKLRRRNAAGPINLIYVGRLEQYKGLHLLLDAIRGLSGVKLTVLGDGGYRSTLEELAIGLDVEFAGFQSDPAPYYEAADIFVMPSLGPEGLPLVALEAMSHSLPCLFSDLPVHCEITENAKAAMLFRCGNSEDLRNKLMILIESSSKREQYAENAYRAIETKYHVDGARRAYLRLFEAGA